MVIGDVGVKTRDYTFSVNAAGDTTAIIADGMGASLLPALEKFRLAGEDLAKTAQRLTTVFKGTNDFIVALGVQADKAFGAYGLAGEPNRQKLIQAAGGQSSFDAAAASFAQNFLTPIQQLQPDLDKVGRAFNDLHISGISTNKQFADLVNKLVGEGNLTLAGQLLSVADSFDKITKAANDSAAALKALLTQDMFRTLPDLIRAQSQAAQGTYYGRGMLATQKSAGMVTGTAGQLIARAQAGVAPTQAKEVISNTALSKQAALEILTSLESQAAAYTNEIASWASQHSKRSDAIAVAMQNNYDQYLAPKLADARKTYDSLKSFAVGTNSLPYDMVAQVHQGERIIPAADNRQLMDMMSNGGDSKGIIAELRALRAELRAANLTIAQNTKDAAKQLIRWDGEGLPETRVVTA
jgi:hypothetical protein